MAKKKKKKSRFFFFFLLIFGAPPMVNVAPPLEVITFFPLQLQCIFTFLYELPIVLPDPMNYYFIPKTPIPSVNGALSSVKSIKSNDQSAVDYALWSECYKFESPLSLPLCGHVKKKKKKGQRVTLPLWTTIHCHFDSLS